jgi:hypothetical protein
MGYTNSDGIIIIEDPQPVIPDDVRTPLDAGDG